MFKKNSAVFFAVGFIACMLFVPATQAQKVRKTVFIIVDGIPADVMEKLNPPNLAALGQNGGYSRAYVGGVRGTYSETPTISAVGYNSVLTGTWVNKHNVWDNDIAEPNYNYHTIFRYLKEQYPQKKTAVFSSWLDNRTKLVGDNFEATGNIPVDYHFDSLEHDKVKYPHDKAREFMSRIDEDVAAHASQAILQQAPDLTWVYLEYTDDMGHMYGDSPQFHKGISLADKRVGYIMNAVKEREQKFNEEWLVIVTTDHGRGAKTGKDHGGQSDRERSGWIYTNAKGLNEQFKQPQLSIVDIMPTIARFMDITVPRNNALEVDGIPFTGAISFVQPTVQLAANKLTISWKALAPNGDVKLWVSSSNNFKSGGNDDYAPAGSVALAAQQAEIDFSAKAPGLYKIVLEAPANTANTWVQKKEDGSLVTKF
ncbi:alkaline phosphatase family protein [Foetidibacter luteolus]|uniref:alkaline phosphatase family protein n=1 Tax=Foetidibacter luteolus TaxID=2608880 RepID=UPI00129A128E|nr:alkaline phosphatase family protein [Foetidibacter luteolus]